jgi:glutamate-ammonia-ligase adenylyltransferase
MKGMEFLILALGKLGGQELNYRSDLDLVFLYRAPGGADSSDAALFQERAHLRAREILNLLNARDQLGPLFEADVRLRPMGSKNLLAVSFDELRRYFEEGTALLWERQAFLRARAVKGSTVLAAEVLGYLRGRMPLAPEEDPEEVKRAIAQMRRRMEDAAKKGDFIKRSRGGIVDVEFIAQTLQIINGRKHPEVLSANTSTSISLLSRAGLLPPFMASELLTSYQFLRWLETRLSLLMAPEESLPAMDRDGLRSLIHRIGYRSSGEVPAEKIFGEELEYNKKKNREHLEQVLGGKV